MGGRRPRAKGYFLAFEGYLEDLPPSVRRLVDDLLDLLPEEVRRARRILRRIDRAVEALLEVLDEW